MSITDDDSLLFWNNTDESLRSTGKRRDEIAWGKLPGRLISTRPAKTQVPCRRAYNMRDCGHRTINGRILLAFLQCMLSHVMTRAAQTSGWDAEKSSSNTSPKRSEGSGAWAIAVLPVREGSETSRSPKSGSARAAADVAVGK